MDFPKGKRTRARRSTVGRGEAHGPARTASATALSERPRKAVPGGKALARLRLFAMQRGLALAFSPRSRTPRGIRRVSAAAPALPYLKAFELKRQKPARSRARPSARRPPPRAAATGVAARWRELGPTSIPRGQTYGTGGNATPSVSGRIAGIAIDPKDARHLVVASAGGGLWESRDLGQSWRPLTDDLPTLSMGAVAFAPSDARIVYAGTGEGDTFSPLGVGLLRSSDGGATWALAATPAAGRMLVGQSFFDLIVDPQDADHLWAATSAGLLESSNGGSTWKQLRAALTWDLSYDAAHGELLAACQDGVFRSTNSGKTWRAVPLSGAPAGAVARIAVCHAPSAGDVAYVFTAYEGTARLWRREAAGDAFVKQTLPSDLEVSQGWYDWYLAVVPDDPDTVFLGAIDLHRGRRKATGAWTWANASSRSSGDSIHPDQHHLAFAPDDPHVVYACNDGGLYRSPDLGTSWRSLNPGLSITEFEFLAQHPTRPAWILGGTQDNGTLRRVRETRWEQVDGGDGGDCGVNVSQPRVCYHTFYDMGVVLSEDGGTGWRDIGPLVPRGHASLFYPPLEVRDELVVQAGESVWITESRGDAWSEIALPWLNTQPQIASALALPSADEVLVGTTKGSLVRLPRGDRGWEDVRPMRLATPRVGYVSDLCVDARGEIWASYSTIVGAHVFVSTDRGASWRDVTADLPPIPVNALVVDPLQLDTIYAGTDNGVYVSRDHGGSWSELGAGLPNAVVGDLVLHESARVLRAGTRNRGVWEIAV